MKLMSSIVSSDDSLVVKMYSMEEEICSIIK